jgi:isoaspartyl peptidase/L-asparaginase-like protein (Ntn-hydrolase superfamily)
MSHPFQGQHGSVVWPAIVVHGGAGTYSRIVHGGARADNLAADLRTAIEASVDTGWDALTGGASPLAAVVAAVTYLENDGRFNAGLGSVPTTAGTVEMDAAVMDDTGRAGAVACIGWHAPIRAAEAVFGHGGPLLIVGPNADTFAARSDVPTLNPVGTEATLRIEESEPGTVGAVAVSADGRFAAATSTGGRAGQLPGRVGDTPIPGAGLWAQRGCAVSAPGTGEAFILAGFCRLVASRHAAGDPLTDALHVGLDVVGSYGGNGGGIALGSDHTWAGAFTTRAMARGVRHAEGRHTAIIE